MDSNFSLEYKKHVYKSVRKKGSELEKWAKAKIGFTKVDIQTTITYLKKTA